jgi:hypothetical protein
MKKLVEHARSLGGQALSLGGTVAGAVRRAVDPPLGEDAKPLDIKRAIVEAVEQRLEPAGGGRRVLPGDGVQVKVLVEQADARRALEAVLADVRDTVVARLLELQCTVPRWFAVDVSYIRRAPADWEAGQRLAVTVVTDAGRTAAKSANAETLPTLGITVLRGQTEQQELTFTEPVVRIGRSTDPTDDRGRPRFNHVAFLENDSPENRTVTRGHAMIRYHTAAAEYRLFDEGSANGTRVIRGGEVIDLPKRDPVGLALRSGDEVQLGKAAIRVRIG